MATDPDTLITRLRGYTYDWNGSEMADEADALTEVKCGLLRAAAARIEAVEAAQLNLVRRGTHFRNAGIRQAADLVEELSKRSKTQWGEIKASIMALQDTTLADDDEHPGWVYAIQYGPEGESDYAWVYDETGRMIATMRTRDAARFARPRPTQTTNESDHHGY